jgi:Domain of unknown function (DUF6249)
MTVDPYLIDKFMFQLLCLGVPAVVLLLPLYWRHRERTRLLEIVSRAAEKGESVPPEILRTLPDRFAPPSAERDLRRGLILIALGVGLASVGIALRLTAPELLGSQGAAVGAVTAALGAIPGCVGVALIMFSRISRISGKP